MHVRALVDAAALPRPTNVTVVQVSQLTTPRAQRK